MQYLILLYADEESFAKMSPDEMKAALAGFAEYNRKLGASGVLRHGEQLQGSRSAKSIKMKAGKVVTLDGPFSESKEQLGGYYVIETATEAEAIEWASKCPIVYSGTVEVRALIPRPA